MPRRVKGTQCHTPANDGTIVDSQQIGLSEMQTLCSTFRTEAGVVWNKMQKAASVGISLSEETLTESSLYSMALAHQGKGIRIDLATKPAEKKHGADWEWWLIKRGRGVCFRIQAKRLFANGRYNSLTKSGASAYAQLDKLVSVSKTDGAEPLYCFYNFPVPNVALTGPNPCKHDYRAPSYWGCALAFPDKVKQAKSNEFKALRPVMHPWHLLVCQSDKVDLVSAANNFALQRGGRDNGLLQRDVPERVSRLTEMGDRLRTSDERIYLDTSYWDEQSGDTSDLAGIVTFRDLRE